MKSSIEEYEANGLNSLLMQMHQWALEKRYVSRQDSLIYFNVAYAVAAPLEETPEFSVKLVRKKIEDLFMASSLKREIIEFLKMTRFLVCGWYMAYYICSATNL